MRTLTNLFLIFVLCFAAIGINPAYAPISLESNTFQKDLSIDNVELTTDTDLSSNPKLLDLYFKYPDSLNYFVSSVDDLFTLEIFKNNELVISKQINPVESTERPYEYNFSDTIHYTIDIDPIKLGLSTGTYDIVIKSNFSDTIKPINFTYNYETSFNYIPSKPIDASMKSMTRLYLPDSTHQYMIPISVKSDEKATGLSGLLKFMKLSVSGFDDIIEMPLIGEFNYGVIKKNILYIDLKSNDSLYTNPTTSNDILNALTQTVSYYYNEPIQFLVDYNKRTIFFNNVNITEPITISHINVAYKLLDLPTRDYLIEVPTAISSDAIIEEQVKAMIDILKNSNDGNIIHILNSNFDYNGVIFLNGTLTINVTDNYPLSPLEMDALGFSLLSLYKVDKVDVRQATKTIAVYDNNRLLNPLK